jgi:monovalent cation/hydrogen antiporter
VQGKAPKARCRQGKRARNNAGTGSTLRHGPRACDFGGARTSCRSPDPVFLALGGTFLTFLPRAPSFTLPPELALALFIASVLLDAAYDASPRDLKDNWAPLTSLVVFAVGLTTARGCFGFSRPRARNAVAAAIALGALVAPPDAAAATAVLRQLRPPHRILTVLEGESLLNDASSLLIYKGGRRRCRSK